MPGFVRVVHEWTAEDRWNALWCRLGRHGARSRVPPGLYALGTPGEESPAVVTASFRLTFDLLRRDLAGVSCWLLVLDTHGLDVASAVAAGRFSTDEVVTAVLSSRLARVVSHRRIVLPGLAAGVVDAGQVARATGFQAVAGPAHSVQLKALVHGAPLPPISGGLSVSGALALAPSELGRALLRYPGFAFAALLYAGLGPGGVSLGRALAGSWPLLLLGLGVAVTGAVVAPVVHAAARRIPLWIAGAAAGAGAAAALLQGARLSAGMDPFLQLGCWLFFPAASALMAEESVRSQPASAAAAPSRPAPALIAIAVLLACAAAAALALSKLGQRP